MKLTITRRLKYLILGAATIAVLAGVMVIRSSSFQVAYHKWQMQRAWDAAFAEPDTFQDGLVGYTVGESYERYEYHRQKLVQLGVVRELNYKLQHIKAPTDESNHFSKFLLSANRPDCIDFSSPYPSEPEAMQLTVWCYAAYGDAWDQLIATRDVPDYKDRFMANDAE